jgi:hypothetical protein
LSASTANSTTAETPPSISPYAGTILPMLRQTNRSPGLACVIISGETRESAHVMKSVCGAWLWARLWNSSLLPGKT